MIFKNIKTLRFLYYVILCNVVTVQYVKHLVTLMILIQQLIFQNTTMNILDTFIFYT